MRATRRPGRSAEPRELLHGTDFAPFARAERAAAARDRGDGACAALRHALLDAGGRDVRIGTPRRLGGGLSRRAWLIPAIVDGGPLSGDWVVLLPIAEAPPGLHERTRREVAILRALRQIPFPYRVPEVLAAWDEDGDPYLIERFLPGVPLDPRADRQYGVRPWDVVGRAAAAVHRAPVRTDGYDTRRAHALAAMARLDAVPGTLGERARAWAHAHLPPPDAPAGLVHGDLLGQNILLGDDEPDALIDWEYACNGDPAYDLAVVTRGIRAPFMAPHGFEKLLDAYHASGGVPLTAAEVHVQELCIVGGWWDGPNRGEAEQRIASLLRRLGG